MVTEEKTSPQKDAQDNFERVPPMIESFMVLVMLGIAAVGAWMLYGELIMHSIRSFGVGR